MIQLESIGYDYIRIQAIASVTQEGVCWTWNLRVWALFPLGRHFVTGLFGFGKDENATIGISVRV